MWPFGGAPKSRDPVCGMEGAEQGSGYIHLRYRPYFRSKTCKTELTRIRPHRRRLGQERPVITGPTAAADEMLG
jgi:hypothetical protein